jgi:hypothetical protein
MCYASAFSSEIIMQSFLIYNADIQLNCVSFRVCRHKSIALTLTYKGNMMLEFELKAKLYFEREWTDAQNVGMNLLRIIQFLVPYLIQERGVAYIIV